MAWRPGKKQLTKAVSLDAADIQAFRELDKLGVKLDLRVVASDPSVNILDKIAEHPLQNKKALFYTVILDASRRQKIAPCDWICQPEEQCKCRKRQDTLKVTNYGNKYPTNNRHIYFFLYCRNGQRAG
jgi:hypothetical protein